MEEKCNFPAIAVPMVEIAESGIKCSRSKGPESGAYICIEHWQIQRFLHGNSGRYGCNLSVLYATQGSFPVRKRTGTLRIWRARKRERIWGSGGGAPSGVQVQSPWSGCQGAKPP